MENSPPNVSVVILNWNGAAHLRRFLPSVVEHTPPGLAEIVVADNGSTDDSIAFLRTHFPQVKLILLDRNYGFTGGYNRALSNIDTPYYVLLNSDVEVTAGWLEPLLEAADDPTVAAVMPKIRSLLQPDSFEYAGAAGGYIDYLGYPFCRGRMLSTLEQDQGQYDRAQEIFWASGACMLVKSEVYHSLRGLDEAFFAHMEEIDLCWRMKNRSYRILCQPASTVYHLGGGTLPNESPRKLYLNFRNNLFMLYKNLPDRKLVPVLLVRMLLDGAAATVYLLKGQGRKFSAVWKAHIDFYRQRKTLRQKRRLHAPGRKYAGCIYQKSFVWGYFRGKKTFSRLRETDFTR